MNMDATDVFILLQRAYQIVYDGEWWNVTGFNEQECYLEHCEDGDETVVPLEKLAKSNVDYYQLVKISDYTPSEKINPFKNPVAAQIENSKCKGPYD
jgi:hypothetical protein